MAKQAVETFLPAGVPHLPRDPHVVVGPGHVLHTQKHMTSPLLCYLILSIPFHTYIHTIRNHTFIHPQPFFRSFVHNHSFTTIQLHSFIHSFIQGIRARNNLQLLPVLCRFLFKVLPLVALAHTKVTALSDRVGVGIRTV